MQLHIIFFENGENISVKFGFRDCKHSAMVYSLHSDVLGVTLFKANPAQLTTAYHNNDTHPITLLN